jgi:hypothetical protein
MILQTPLGTRVQKVQKGSREPSAPFAPSLFSVFENHNLKKGSHDESRALYSKG